MVAAERRVAYTPLPGCAGRGEVPERSIGAVSKTVVPLAGTEGSNPSLSARTSCIQSVAGTLRFLAPSETVLIAPVFVLKFAIAWCRWLVTMWA